MGRLFQNERGRMQKTHRAEDGPMFPRERERERERDVYGNHQPGTIERKMGRLHLPSQHVEGLPEEQVLEV